MSASHPSALTRVTRALRLQCPECGAGPIIQSWFQVADRCPRCGLRTSRGEEGYQVGAYMFNIVFAELVFMALFVATLLATWPDPPWSALTYGGALAMLLLPFLFFPVSRTLFLAFDLIFRPRGYEPDEDLPDGPGPS